MLNRKAPKALLLLPVMSLALICAIAVQSQAQDKTTQDKAANEDPGITVPEGFVAEVFADNIGNIRHIAFRDNGDLYCALNSQRNGGGIAALRDADNNGKADSVRYFGRVSGTGITIQGNLLYFGTDTSVVRFELPEGELMPTQDPTTILSGFPNQRGYHAAKSIDVDAQGNLYINSGAPSNACQERDRANNSPGLDPCPYLEVQGGIWKYSADKPNQTHPADGERIATGLRNCVALDFNTATGDLYTVQHGRDQLNGLYPDLYTPQESAELPSEELHRITPGFDGGWPTTYWNHLENKRIIAPEYGGDSEKSPQPNNFNDPIQAFPGHWAPNGMAFYTGAQFPDRYRNGLFIAWHGSWNRSPLRQGGYKVTFTPFDGPLPSGDYEVFADGFAGTDNIQSPRQAKARPMGLAVAPNGDLYISDSLKGKIWRVRYVGNGDTRTTREPNNNG